MYAFYDTEFTDFKNQKLISIGMVRSDGQKYYAVLSDTWCLEDCNPFVVENVLPILAESNKRRTIREVEADLREFLKEGYTLICDSLYDWLFIHNIFQDKLPAGCRCEQVAAKEEDIESFFKETGLTRHNAISDAIALFKALAPKFMSPESFNIAYQRALPSPDSAAVKSWNCRLVYPVDAGEDVMLMLPKELLSHLGVGIGSQVDIDVDPNQPSTLTIRPSR